MSQTQPKPRLLFVSILGQPGYYRPEIFARVAGGDDEVAWFKSMLNGLGLLDRVSYRGVFHARGEPLPAHDAYDAVIVGGSFHSAHDGLPWQDSLWDWMRESRAAGKPLFGICGGHQLMALRTGGSVDRLKNGRKNATMQIDLTEAGRDHYLFKDLASLDFHFGNGERVAKPPPGAVVLAQSDDLPAMALDHGSGWVSVQFHPEAKAEILAASWTDTAPEFAENYCETPEAPRLFKNFLKAHGLLS
ncbi:MAG: gamma-glutamyl-gamma-aminobutyrate hydrolase family protein [Alphaproteobacteria bacterium]|nr:gamma-glutamyl-gamma-aminobutyrate hydrolase family protein [Alphaproteobacteria bacterium]